MNISDDMRLKISILTGGVNGEEIILSEYTQEGIIYRRVLRRELEWKKESGYTAGRQKGSHCRRVINVCLKRRNTNDDGHWTREKIKTIKVIENWRPLCRGCGCVLWEQVPEDLAQWCSPYRKGASYCRMCWKNMKNEQSEE